MPRNYLGNPRKCRYRMFQFKKEPLTLAEKLERDMKNDPELRASIQAIRDFCRPKDKPTNNSVKPTCDNPDSIK